MNDKAAIDAALAECIKARDALLLALGLDPVWSEHPDHPVQGWQLETGDDYTRLSYAEWCAARIVEGDGQDEFDDATPMGEE